MADFTESISWAGAGMLSLLVVAAGAAVGVPCEAQAVTATSAAPSVTAADSRRPNI
jgi:hypothetical protein